jgi:cardiolipin synthase C
VNILTQLVLGLDPATQTLPPDGLATRYRALHKTIETQVAAPAPGIDDLRDGWGQVDESMAVGLAQDLTGQVSGCAGPPLKGRGATRVVADTAGTRLGRALAPRLAAHPGCSGIHALSTGMAAFAARVLLARVAERSLDVQCYIWRADATGLLLFEALLEAAGRGVRVRLLLDDNNTAGLDETLAVLDAHPGIELRLYNPVRYRGWRALNFVTDFERSNRRMHNKSFTADNLATIVGGRNIGDEYFGVETEVEFTDLDVLAVGPAVQSVSDAFDRYWNSASACPAASLLGAAPAGDADRLHNRFEATRADPESIRYGEALRASPFIGDLLARRLLFEWAHARLVVDDPAKTLALTRQADALLLPALLRTIGSPSRSLDLVSPYFVPGAHGTATLIGLARRGVKLRILTNSLSSTDVGVVHAGYAKRRHDLLAAGVRLFEVRRSAAAAAAGIKSSSGMTSSSSLHAKIFALDGRRIFVGSFNFDPRSARLNTEMGLVIDSPLLARHLAGTFDDRIPLLAYEVRLAPQGGGLQWLERTPNGETRHATEPETTLWRRLGVDLISLLPIEWML